jgi:hypothetical protein
MARTDFIIAEKYSPLLAISSTRSIRHWDRSKNENDFQPNRSLTKALERAATVEPSVLHNATSYISTISNSWTRLDLDELDDELHRVARLDRNLDIVRQQVGHIPLRQKHRIFVSLVLRYPAFRFKPYSPHPRWNIMNMKARSFPRNQVISEEIMFKETSLLLRKRFSQNNILRRN